MPILRFAGDRSCSPEPNPVLDQTRLNIQVRSRTSRLPWKGQFSPDLVKYLMDVVCPDSDSFLDPFCGSGTVLFEALERGRSAYGSEVNPAAWHLASLASFSGLPLADQDYVLGRLKSFATEIGFDYSDIFKGSQAAPDILCKITTQDHPFLRTALACVVLLGMGDKEKLTHSEVARGTFTVISLLRELKTYRSVAECHLSDARKLPIPSASLGASITSPPYINVFNYHQNYRVAAELLGWQPLQAARSEFGSNRKHRANRFLTVIQYCLDIGKALEEMCRVLRDGAPIVVVVGRTSNVLGTPFSNSTLISELFASGGYGVDTAERVFTNRYGAEIYEDILMTHKSGDCKISPHDARAIGATALVGARGGVPEKSRAVLEDAISQVGDVFPSPLLSLQLPSAFQPSYRPNTGYSHASG